ncbi:MAG: conjugal transfer ATP-binding protein TraC [Patescibacteria group bacterium]|jgi:conjugal transfer ATP-binding protein TraC
MYEIPQELVYKERIIFGLTFEQLLYVLICLPILLLIYRLDLGLKLSICLAIIPVCIAIGFMFLDFKQLLFSWCTWIINRHLSEEEIEPFFAIKEIKDDMIYLEDKKVAILKIEPINFAIKDSKSKDSMIMGFQKLLNSLDYPIQIIMTTEKLNLSVYLSYLKKSITKKFIPYYKDYQKYLYDLMKHNNVSNRNFYIAIPETLSIDIQLQIIQERLASLNLKSRRIGTFGIIKLLKKMFEEKTSLYPKEISNRIDCVEINDMYYRTISVSGYPRNVESGFLDRIVSSQGNFNLSMHIEPIRLDRTFIMLNRELAKQRADLYASKLKNQLNSSLEIQCSDTLKVLEHLQKGDERLFSLTLYVTCKAKSKAELDLLTKKVESELNGLMIIPKVNHFRMLDGLKSTLPLLSNSSRESRYITTNPLSAFFPFTSSFFSHDNAGICFGLNKNKIPIIKDIFGLSNPNGLVLAQSGGGKSYFSKLLITRYLLNGTKVMIIDPQGEYNSLISHFEGQRIDLSKDSDTIINPMDLMGHDYISKRLTLMDLMKIMLGDLSDIQKAFIDKAITKTYEKKGIGSNPDTWNNEPPILEDLLKTLRTMERTGKKLEQVTLNSLANRLDMYVSGVFSFFNQKTNLDIDNTLVSFDIGRMPSQVKPAVMFMVLDYVYMKMKSDLSRKILLIDEAWTLLSRTEEAGYIFEIVKTCRKFNLGLLLINQEVEGLLDSKAGKSVLANSAYTILMRQKPAVIDNICKTFHLSTHERNHLLTAGIGEGLMIMEDDHSELRVTASSIEHKVITTKPEEVEDAEVVKVVKKKGRNITINVDENDRFFRKSEVSKDEEKFLLDKGYKKINCKSLVSGVYEDFLLQPRHNESLTHLFVTYDVAEYLEKKGFSVKKYVTVKPDIVFEKGGKKWAIEVETGAGLSKISQMEGKLKVLSGYDDWIFIVTNPNKVKRYREFGDVIDSRQLLKELDVFVDGL